MLQGDNINKVWENGMEVVKTVGENEVSRKRVEGVFRPSGNDCFWDGREGRFGVKNANFAMFNFVKCVNP